MRVSFSKGIFPNTKNSPARRVKGGVAVVVVVVEEEEVVVVVVEGSSRR